MNVISYDIEVKRSKKSKGALLDILKNLIQGKYSSNGPSFENSIQDAWINLPHEELKSIRSPNFVLCAFNTENTQVFLFKNFSNVITSNTDATITVVALSDREINFILKSSYLKIKEIFGETVGVSIIEGTYVNIYPFESSKNDIISPHFFIKANFDKNVKKLEIREWVKLGIITLITAIFIILFFNTPSEIVESSTNKEVPNDLKTLYSAIMSFGISVILLEVITNLLIPYAFKSKHPKVYIANFANIIENNNPSQDSPATKSIKPTDPQIR